MPKNVAMFTMINGEPMRVGTCHPGQARILQKNGKAEWKEGKLWLSIGGQGIPDDHTLTINQSREVNPVYNALGEVVELLSGRTSTTVTLAPNERRDRDYLMQDGVELVGTISANHTALKVSHQAQEIFDEIDPNREIRGKYRRQFEEKRYPTAEAFFIALGLKVQDDHNLWPCDEPKRLMLGYIDDDTNEHMLLGLRHLKEVTPEQWDDLAGPFDLTGDELRECMKSEAGRSRIVGSDGWEGVVDSVLDDLPQEVQDLLTKTPDPDLWDRGHKQETMEAFGDHLPITKRLSVATKKVGDRRGIREEIQTPTGWAVFQWPRDKSRIGIVDSHRKLMGPPDEPWSVGAYRRKGRRLVRVYTLQGQVLWDAAQMEEVWKGPVISPETGGETLAALDIPGTGVYVSLADEPNKAAALEQAYRDAEAWVLGQK